MWTERNRQTELYYEELAYMIMEAKISHNLASAGDPGELVV